MVGGGGRLVEHCMFQNRNPVRVFLYHCISDGNQLFSENCGCHFHFILHIMSDKAAFVRGALFCVHSVTGETSLSPTPTAPPAGRELICRLKYRLAVRQSQRTGTANQSQHISFFGRRAFIKPRNNRAVCVRLGRKVL